MGIVTPVEAIQILDKIASMVQMNRVDHSRAIEAVSILRKVVEEVTLERMAKKEKKDG